MVAHFLCELPIYVWGILKDRELLFRTGHIADNNFVLCSAFVSDSLCWNATVTVGNEFVIGNTVRPGQMIDRFDEHRLLIVEFKKQRVAR